MAFYSRRGHLLTWPLWSTDQNQLAALGTLKLKIRFSYVNIVTSLYYAKKPLRYVKGSEYVEVRVKKDCLSNDVV